MEATPFDCCNLAVTIAGLIALVIRYRRGRRKTGLPFFDMNDFPPPGSTEGGKREWRRKMREQKINRALPLKR